MEHDHPLLKNITRILDATGRSAALTRQLLAFARKQAIAPEVFDINDAVEELLKMLRRLIGEHIDLDWLPTTHPSRVRLDPSQLDQVLANLCVNARDAIGDVGRVAIETDLAIFDEAACKTRPGCRPGEYVVLSVSDNGCGMDKDTLERIFEPFFTTKPVGKGTGLGFGDRVRHSQAETTDLSASTASRARGRPLRSIFPGMRRRFGQRTRLPRISPAVAEKPSFWWKTTRCCWK